MQQATSIKIMSIIMIINGAMFLTVIPGLFLFTELLNAMAGGTGGSLTYKDIVTEMYHVPLYIPILVTLWGLVSIFVAIKVRKYKKSSWYLSLVFSIISVLTFSPVGVILGLYYILVLTKKYNLEAFGIKNFKTIKANI